MLISALAVLAYLEVPLICFLNFVLKEALTIVILATLFLSYQSYNALVIVSLINHGSSSHKKEMK